jgi:hypothetical protein
MVGVLARDPKGLLQCFQLQKDLIVTTPTDIGYHLTTTVINRMPTPLRRLLALDEPPPGLDVCRVCTPHHHCALIRV